MMHNYNRDIFRYAVKCNPENVKVSKRGRIQLVKIKRNNMKRLIVRIVMIAAWIVGVGFSFLALETNIGANDLAVSTPMSTLYWAVPLAALGLAYFVLNIYWSQRRHNLKRMI